MTRQEAIKILDKYDLSFCDIDGNPIPPQDLAEAFDMAIQALEQEPCDDRISRKEIIRWVKTECNPYGKPTLDFESGKKVIEHLEQMPSAEVGTQMSLADRPTGHWIENDNGTFSCSNCQSWIPEEQHHYARYCLYCGARMESDGE